MARTLTDTATIERTPEGPDALPGFHGLVGRSVPMQALFERIRRLAPYDVPVLIVGEPGTGTTGVARVLHALSPRRAGPLAVVDCAAPPPELFPYGVDVWAGSSSGMRDRDVDGLEALRGGTLLLDEIGDLPPAAQAGVGQLIRRLAERPAGADIRLVATTPRDLLWAAQAGAFRPDLYYALRRAVLRVPPLRDRLDDLPWLVEHVRRRVTARHGLQVAGVTASAVARLTAHPWPGNVRELEAVLEEAMLLQGEGWLGADRLSLDPPPHAGRIVSAPLEHRRSRAVRDVVA